MNIRIINLCGMLTASLFIAACNPVASTSTVKVYKLQSSISCDPGSGTSLTSMLGEFNRNAITVKSSHCGSDGLVRAAVCGVSTGKLNVYEIDSSDLNRAKGLGFRETESLKGYSPSSC